MLANPDLSFSRAAAECVSVETLPSGAIVLPEDGTIMIGKMYG